MAIVEIAPFKKILRQHQITNEKFKEIFSQKIFLIILADKRMALTEQIFFNITTESI